MSRTRPPLEQGRLFDLELDEEERDREGPPRVEPEEQEESVEDEAGTGLPSVREVPLDRPAGIDAGRRPAGSAAEDSPADGRPAPGPRFLSGAMDAGLHLALGVLLLGALASMGVPVTDPRTLAAATLVVLLFSFFYTVISLAFWGATPGMTAVDLRAETGDGEPLAFGQAARRWAAGALTVAAAGLPALLVLSGRSLADRWSGSAIVQV